MLALPWGDRQAADLQRCCPRAPPAPAGWATTVLLPGPEVTLELDLEFTVSRGAQPGASLGLDLGPRMSQEPAEDGHGKQQVLRSFQKEC